MKYKLPISRKVNKDLNERISSTLSSLPASEAEAKRLFNAYLEGVEPASDDAVAMIAFSMIRTEVDRAMERSRRARQRAAQAKQAREFKEAREAREGREDIKAKEDKEVMEAREANQVEVRPVSEEEREAERLRVLTVTGWSLRENLAEVRRLLFREARRDYNALTKRMLEKAQADKIKYKHEHLYFNPPEFSDYTSVYVNRRLKEIERNLAR